MRKIAGWIYPALTLLLIGFFAGLVLNRSGTGALVVSTERAMQSVSSETLPERSVNGSTASQGLISVNSADENLLQQLPGIGSVRAQAIVAYRQTHGPFQSLSDLLQVPGIGQGILNQIKDKITLEDSDENIDH